MANDDLNTLEHQQALLVRLELGEAVSRMEREGVDPRAVLAGMAALVNDYLANASDQATAASYFFGLARHAAQLAADEMKH